MIAVSGYIEEDIFIEINKKIEVILGFFIDVCEDSSYEEHMQFIFPPDFFEEKTEECKKIIRELYQYSRDTFAHYLSPIKEYALYSLFDWYLEVTEEDLTFTATRTHPEADKEYMKTYGIEDFKEIIFEDHDFLDVDLWIYLNETNRELLEQFDVNLEKYKDLMPNDKREEYIEAEKEHVCTNLEIDEEELILHLIHSAIQRKQLNVRRLLKTSETELSDDIADYMSAKLNELNINVDREKPAGFALKNVGELDFFIHRTTRGKYEKIAIGENKEWGTYKAQFKQLIGYMDRDIKFGFTIIFNKTVRLKTVLESRKKILEEFSIEIDGNTFFQVNRMEEMKGLKDVVITYHKNPEDESEFKVYHFIINAFLPERIEVAQQARRKRK
ncbi:hypothetical protein [Peribacillus sp. NPDC097895]|uniref:hypothetical protein n=1 Tax=Peribacillus sp. NPDC097895 TaxID=3390619 RepID=UPI003D0437D4